MKTSPSRRAFMFLPFVCAALYGCPHAEDSDPGSVEFADVIYFGDATDEAMVALGAAIDQKAPADDPTRAPHLDAPSATPIPASPIPTFQWHLGAPTTLAPTHFMSPSPLLAPTAPRAAEPSWLAGLGALIGPPRAAHAHGTPLVGPATFLVFSTATNPKLVRVLTDQLTFLPDQATWDKLVAAKSEITLSLVGADFDNNRIASGGAPVQGTKFVFTITP